MSVIWDAAIVGNGFAGLMTAANLARRAPDFKIIWIGPGPLTSFGRGLAYGTTEFCHLLNVRADKMGAWADRPDDFHEWLDRTYPGKYLPGDYVPRAVYGIYLDSIRMSLPPNITPLSATVTLARRDETSWMLSTGADEILARHVILATGNPPIAPLNWPRNHRYVDDFWRWRLETPRLPNAAALQEIVIAGAGLTAADAALSLLQDGYKGRITMISPHGSLPRCHQDPVAAYEHTDTLLATLKTNASARHYLRTLRAHITQENWRGVIDSLRPHTTSLWQALPEVEKARFMRHLWSRWNIHRHRMAPQIDTTLKDRIKTIPGRITMTSEDGRITVSPRNGNHPDLRIHADLILNCTGPSYRGMISNQSLLKNLLEEGYISPGPLGLGMAISAAPGLHTLGTILLGSTLETTAVPELRQQAARIAAAIK